jgi:hypothetical protein
MDPDITGLGCCVAVCRRAFSIGRRSAFSECPRTVVGVSDVASLANDKCSALHLDTERPYPHRVRVNQQRRSLLTAVYACDEISSV